MPNKIKLKCCFTNLDFIFFSSLEWYSPAAWRAPSATNTRPSKSLILFPPNVNNFISPSLFNLSAKYFCYRNYKNIFDNFISSKRYNFYIMLCMYLCNNSARFYIIYLIQKRHISFRTAIYFIKTNLDWK